MPPSPPKFSALLNRLSYSDAPAKNIANAKSLLSLQRAVEIPEDLIPSQSAGKEDKFWKYLLNEHKDMEQAHHDAAMAAHATSIHANNTWDTFSGREGGSAPSRCEWLPDSPGGAPPPTVAIGNTHSARRGRQLLSLSSAS
jgi:hypothetical protein